MGYETISAMTDNIEAALKAEGFSVTRRALDDSRSLAAGMMPLAQVLYKGESFESPFGERPGYSEARFTIKIVLPAQDGSQAIAEEQRLAHMARNALTESALNAGGLAAARPVTGVKIPGFDIENNGGFSKISIDVNARYRES